jgi:isochorismate hydrolase
VRTAILPITLPDQVSLPQTPFGWRVTPNRVMLLLNERYFQADFASGHRALPIKGFA